MAKRLVRSARRGRDHGYVNIVPLERLGYVRLGATDERKDGANGNASHYDRCSGVG